MNQRNVEELSADECFELLSGANVGRLVYVDEAGPLAIPVNFTVAEREIIFRVSGGAKQAAMSQPMVAFEVDHIDDDHHAGWSVLLRGTGSELTPESLPALLEHLHGAFPKPWAAGVHNTWLKLTPTSITGRRLGREYSPPVF
jgi:nitroimidazol reductase NimA-like FMN-containing flavoprotein (pyridoxamine 5'-phosphate oxidase superfamily)